jgi:hypothetical protein
VCWRAHLRFSAQPSTEVFAGFGPALRHRKRLTQILGNSLPTPQFRFYVGVSTPSRIDFDARLLDPPDDSKTTNVS